MSQCNQRSAQDLQKALYPHVYNEINQLVRIIDCSPTPCDQIWVNARVESIAVHVRALQDFFAELPGQNPDDMHASQFGFAQWLKHDQAVRDRTNKDIAHLTWSRLPRYPVKSTWDLHELTPLFEICAAFARHYQNTHARWTDLASRLECLVQRPKAL